jgi:hypothetical protein
MMNRIFRTNVATYEAVVAIERVLPSHLEKTMFRAPFILKDAIGMISPVHMDFFNSWDSFNAILRLRFQDVQGFKKVQNCFKNTQPRERSSIRTRGIACFWQGNESI